MHPFEKENTGSLPGVSPHLDVRLKSGWRFDRRRRSLVSNSGDPISLKKTLPAGTKVVLMAPTVAAAPVSTLTEDEELLARYLQIILPLQADLQTIASSLRKLDAVEQVTTPPQIGLP